MLSDINTKSGVGGKQKVLLEDHQTFCLRTTISPVTGPLKVLLMFKENHKYYKRTTKSDVRGQKEVRLEPHIKLLKEQ